MQRALVHFLHNPMPPQSGAHRRCLQMLQGLKEAGYEVTLASSTLHSETTWTQTSIDALRRSGISRVEVFDRGYWSRKLDGLERRSGWSARRRLPAVQSTMVCPASARLWFYRLAHRISPDLLFINYCWFDQLVPAGLKCRSVIETHDMIAVNAKLRNIVEDLLLQHEQGQAPQMLFDERFMEKVTVTPDDEELAIYDKYDDTVAISPSEAAMLARRLSHSRVRLIEVMDQPRWISNSYDGPVVLAVGRNPFNSQACLYFSQRVWPKVRKALPDARAVIVGNARLPSGVGGPGLDVLGFVDDLASLYATAPVAVSPVFVGTGQQIKVVEALAHGVPVVALKTKTLSALLENGATGLVSDNADEMADSIVRLLENRKLCAEYGSEGRQRVAKDAVARRGLPALFGDTAC